MRYRVKAIRGGVELLTLPIDAMSREEAVQQVEGQGLDVLSVKAGSLSAWFGWPRRATFSVLEFSHELLSLLEAGLTLVEAIQAICEKELDEARRRALASLLTSLKRGARFSSALEAIPNVFSALYVATVRASERTGTVKEALSRYVAYQQQVERVRARVVSASLYPMLLLFVGGLVALFLLSYVVPRFSRIYENLGENLPWASRALMHLGQTIDNHGALVLATVIILGLGGYALWRRGEGTAAAVRWLARLPSIGAQVRLYELGRFYRTLSMLLRAGMPAVAGMELAKGVLSSELRAQAERTVKAVREGASFSEAMHRHGLTTPVALRMLVVAERSGELGGMLERIAVFHEDELTKWVERFTRLFEPILMAAIGLVIGVIVVFMYMPIFELAEGIR